MRVAIYLRVSTARRKTQEHADVRVQTVETQRVALLDYAKSRGWDVVREYADEGISGAKDRRPALDNLMADARRRRFDMVLVARFDRFARSVRHLVNALQEFQELGIDFVSLTECIDTSTSAGRMLFTILAAFAQFERDVITERIMMGLSRAEKEGKHLGRPRTIYDRQLAAELYAAGLSYRAIAARCGTTKDTIKNQIVPRGSKSEREIDAPVEVLA